MYLLQTRSGSVTTQLLMAMMVVCMLLPITMLCISSVRSNLQFMQEVQDQTALLQLRRILVRCSDLQVGNESLYYEDCGQQRVLRQAGRRLIIQPGTQIILDDIDGLFFGYEEGLYYLQYTRGQEVMKCVIAHD